MRASLSVLQVLVLGLALLIGGCADSNDFEPPVPTAPPAQESSDDASSSDDDEEAPAEEEANMITGSIVKGPVDGALVIIYDFDGVTELGRGDSAGDGTFSISIGTHTGGVLLSASGGTYTDEATGAEGVPFGGTEMRAAYMIPESLTPPFETTVNVTPFTEIAVRSSLVDGVIDPQLLAEANSDFFDLGENAIDIIKTLPTNPLLDSVGEGTVEDLYGIYLAVVSQVIANEGLASWDVAVDRLEVKADFDSLMTAGLQALGESDTAAGASITVDLATTALSSIVEIVTGGGSSGGSQTINVNLVDNVGLSSYDIGLRLLSGLTGEELATGRIFTGNNTLAFEDVADGTAYLVAIRFGAEFNDVKCTLSNESGTLEGSDADVTLTCDQAASSEEPSSSDLSSDRICSFGEPQDMPLPASLLGAMGDLTLSFVTDSSGLTQGTVSMFSFNSDGTLTIDGAQVALQAYGCGNSEIFWNASGQGRTYALSFRSDGSFNEVNINDSSNGAFLGQYSDENGDFSSVTNQEDSSSSDGSSSDSSVDGVTGGTDAGQGGDFTLTISGTVTTTTFGISTTVDITALTIENIAAVPDANDDFTTLIEDNGFDVTGTVSVEVINNSSDRVTFKLTFEGTSGGVSATYELTYDYQRS